MGLADGFLKFSTCNGPVDKAFPVCSSTQPLITGTSVSLTCCWGGAEESSRLPLPLSLVVAVTLVTECELTSPWECFSRDSKHVTRGGRVPLDTLLLSACASSGSGSLVTSPRRPRAPAQQSSPRISDWCFSILKMPSKCTSFELPASLYLKLKVFHVGRSVLGLLDISPKPNLCFQLKHSPIGGSLSLWWLLAGNPSVFCFVLQPVLGVSSLHTRFSQGAFKCISAQTPSLESLVLLLRVGYRTWEYLKNSAADPAMSQGYSSNAVTLLGTGCQRNIEYFSKWDRCQQ